MDEQTRKAADMLCNARRLKGYTQQEIASLANIDIRQYQRLELGERRIDKINIKMGLTICKLLDIDPYELIFPDGKIQEYGDCPD